MVQSISQLIIIHLNGWYCAYFLPPRRNFRKHNALSNKVRSRCCKFSIFGIFWAACMKNQSEIQVSCAQVFATYMRQIFDKTYKIVKIYLINFFMAKTNMFWIFFHQKWPNLGPMAKLTYNHIFRGEKVRRGMHLP